jgi:serine/threonine protein kinase
MTGPTRRKLGSYEVERELGRGGMGIVYLAHQPVLDRPVVVKALRRDLAASEDVAERFTREAQAAAGIHHQNVVGVYDSFHWRGECFIVQEYVAGEDLGSVLKSAGRLAPRIAVLVALELARGLEEIHARGVVHRDLKPGNVMLGSGGEAKIGDFGIALDPSSRPLTQTGVALGTPTHMAPEQHRGERADQRSDLFAFGVVLFEMLTGELPWENGDGEAEPTLLRRMESGRHPAVRRLAPDTPRRLARLVHECLRAKTRRRPASATAVRVRLEGLADGAAPLACRAAIANGLWQRGVFSASADETQRRVRIAPPQHRRRPPGWAVAMAAAAAVLAGVGAVRFGLVPTPEVLSGLEWPAPPADRPAAGGASDADVAD